MVDPAVFPLAELDCRYQDTISEPQGLKSQAARALADVFHRSGYRRPRFLYPRHGATPYRLPHGSRLVKRDIRAEYARLKSLGWIQQRIAKAKGLKTHTLVSERLRLHNMSDKVKRFVTEGKITEENLREIIQLLLSDTLSPWLTTSHVWEELESISQFAKCSSSKQDMNDNR